MAATTYGTTTARVTLSSAISGVGDAVVPDTTITYVTAKEIDLSIEFKSKVKNQAYGKSRLTPDLKYRQGFQVMNGTLVGYADLNGTTEWLMTQYIAKTPIYGIVMLPPATGTTYKPKSWYNSSQTKVYYLKGVLGKLTMKITGGRCSKISFDFTECWS